MTEKELLYIKDVLSHEQDLEKICSNFSNEVSEEYVKNFIIYLENKYRMHFETFYGILN